MANGSDNLVLSKEAQKKIRAVTRSLTEERRMFVQAKEQQAKKQEIESKRLERRQRRYIRLARKGFAMLTAFARSATMRKFFRVTSRPFTFYHGKGRINLFSDGVQILFLWGTPCSSEDFMFPHNSPEKFNEWICDSPHKFNVWIYDYEKGGDGDGICSQLTFWSEERACRSRREKNNLAMEDSVLSVLIDCADPKKFKGYLTNALKKNR